MKLLKISCLCWRILYSMAPVLCVLDRGLEDDSSRANLTLSERKIHHAFLDAILGGTENLWYESFTDMINNSSIVSKTEKIFLLQSLGFYDLQAYLYVGKTLPSSKSAFLEEFTPAAFNVLHELDPEIYGQTVDTLVDIHNTCKDFNDEIMSKWLDITKDMISYAENSITQLSGPGKFRDQLVLLNDPKYYTVGGTDSEFIKSVAVCHHIVTEMAEAAKSYAETCSHLIKKLNVFLGIVEFQKNRVDFLDRQYNTGPVTDAKDGKPRIDPKNHKMFEPYAIFLQKDLAEARNNITNAINKYNSLHVDWARDTKIASTTPLYVWDFPFGTFMAITTAGIFGGRAYAGQLNMNAADAERAAAQIVADDISPLVDIVNHVAVQIHDVNLRLPNALTELREIEAAFLLQQRNYDLIKADLLSADSMFAKSFVIRNHTLGVIGEGVAGWVEVKELAQVFLNNSAITYVAKPDGSYPNSSIH